ncbi:Meiotic septin, putative (Sporulation-regulated protein, putative) [Candida maltosa Xu316]|uniref:Meiotic septin, putative (Sporulation-regulated protein, putative) n=1 Tax=Candida maltosa (strain Xu316) TaxID=1245528 RepID=M3J3S5_CANMX|nr:Meiotic septin, putative (Sporulation-regulated protein, putative) [Candida maltosa Xu316]
MVLSAENIRQKQKLIKGVNFNLLVVGVNDLGKKTFINTLIQKQYYQAGTNEANSNCIYKSNTNESSDTLDYSDFSIETNSFYFPGSSVPIKLRVSVTNNFGFNCYDDSHGNLLLSFIENQLRSMSNEEMKITRTANVQDGRIHLALYFLYPSKTLSKFDIEMMSKICHRVNLLPVIAYRDSLTDDELDEVRKSILNDIMKHRIKIFDFLGNVVDDEESNEFATVSSEEYRFYSELNKSIPFAIIGANRFNDSGLLRSTQWGEIDVENEHLCDVKLLRTVIFESHLQEFKDTTVNNIYENFRIEQLMEKRVLSQHR